jgi:hypothetical protein
MLLTRGFATFCHRLVTFGDVFVTFPGTFAHPWRAHFRHGAPTQEHVTR